MGLFAAKCRECLELGEMIIGDGVSASSLSPSLGVCHKTS